MTDNTAILLNYKGYNILIKQTSKGKFIMGICGKVGIDIWLEKVKYNNLQIARTSGREYARIMIDKILVSRKENHYEKRK